MCVLLHLLICTALRAHIILGEALYKLLLLYIGWQHSLCGSAELQKIGRIRNSDYSQTVFLFHMATSSTVLFQFCVQHA